MRGRQLIAQLFRRAPFVQAAASLLQRRHVATQSSQVGMILPPVLRLASAPRFTLKLLLGFKLALASHGYSQCMNSTRVKKAARREAYVRVFRPRGLVGIREFPRLVSLCGNTWNTYSTSRITSRILYYIFFKL